ncbi:hypothetical protein BHE90_016317 [Fusarium euwallaceae]|uniref:Uncharacterized protein n=1 Tax=Fusarium euwallaceae TaxID=1147111 RepID=A0A430L0R6_9HYPO|nr:hypothetical protein BHE90_016317 [Fusarium euwallaceae]
MSSPNIPLLLEAREFEYPLAHVYNFQWPGGSCIGHAMLVLNNKKILSQLPKTEYHHKILGYLETTKFKHFEINHSEKQGHVLKSNGGNQGYLIVQFLPKRVRITGELLDIPEEVVWKDGSSDGSAIDAMNPRETPDSYIEPLSEEPSESVPRSVASSVRSQATQTDPEAPPTSDAPHDGENMESQSRYLQWSDKEDNRLPINQVPTTAGFQGAPGEVKVWNSDHPLGFATNVNPHLTLDDRSSEKLSTSIRVSASPEEVSRSQSVLTKQSAPCSSPLASELTTKRTKLPWSKTELDLLKERIRGGVVIDPKDFPNRSEQALKRHAYEQKTKLEGFEKKPAIKVAMMVREGATLDKIVEALPGVSEEEVEKEYHHVKR